MSIIIEPDKKFNSLVMALAYLKRHPTRYIFPVAAQKKFPPCLKDNLASNCSNDPVKIKEWSRRFPGCNWAVAHKRSRLMVADVDTNPAKGKQGRVTYDALDLMYGWPETETTTTPSGGFHLIYEGEHVMALGKNGFGLDIDSPNYTLIPGCTFADGTSYTTNGAQAVAAPDWFYEVIKSAKTKARIINADEVVVDLDQDRNVTLAIDYLKEDAEPAIEGSGGDFNTFKTAAYLKDIGISPGLALDLMIEHYNPRCSPEWDRAGMQRKVTSGYTYSNLSKAGGKTAEADFADDNDPVDLDSIPVGMGIFDFATGTYIKKDPAVVAMATAARETAKEIEASRPADVGARKYSKATLCTRWVYLRGLERFVCRDDPAPRKRGEEWDPDVNERPIYSAPKFDKAFRSLATKKAKSISDTLLSEKKGTVMHFENMVYRPGQPEFAGPNYNVYRKSGIVIAPAATDEARADVKFFCEHVEYLLDEESRNHLLNFLAWRIQYPGKKMKHALIFQGEHKGTGKSFVGRVMAELLGSNNVAYPRETDLSNKFNAWAAASQFIIVEELRAFDKHKIKQNLHPLISEEMITVEFKGVDAKKFLVCFGVLAYTNDEVALSLDIGDRRYLVIKSDAVPRDKPVYGDGYDVNYYSKLFAILDRPDSLGAIGYLLQQRDLNGYSAAASAPNTAAKAVMTAAGGSPLQGWMIENADKWPLCARLTTVEEIAVVVPRVFNDKYLYQNIASALKAGLNGVSIRIPVNGIKKSLWAINADVEVNTALMSRDKAIKADDKKKVTSRNMWLAATYEADRAAARKNGQSTAVAVDEMADVEE